MKTFAKLAVLAAFPVALAACNNSTENQGAAEEGLDTTTEMESETMDPAMGSTGGAMGADGTTTDGTTTGGTTGTTTGGTTGTTTGGTTTGGSTGTTSGGSATGNSPGAGSSMPDQPPPN